MNAGQYKHPIEIWRETKSVNEYGETINGEFVKVCETRALVLTDTISRETTNNNVDYQYQRNFRVHRYVDVREYDEIKYKNRFYRILDIDESEVWNDKEIIAETVL